MIPLGVLGSARVPASGGGPVVATHRHYVAALSATGVSIGTDTTVLVVVTVRTADATAVTLNGVGMTLDATYTETVTGRAQHASIWRGSGSGAVDVSVSWSGTNTSAHSLAVYSADAPVALVDSAGFVSGPESIDTATDGFIVAAASSNSGSHTWTGLTELADVAYKSHAWKPTTDGTAVSITTGGSAPAVCAASYRSA